MRMRRFRCGTAWPEGACCVSRGACASVWRAPPLAPPAAGPASPVTPSERNALLFLGALLLLGVSVRLIRGRAGESHPSDAERAALSAQIAAVDSVRGSRTSTGGAARSRAGGTGAGTSTSRASSGRASKSRTTASPPPPPEPPLRPVAPPPVRQPRRGGTDSRVPIPDSRPTDLDLASLQEIEALPWIGPVLAARIVADRDSLGPFGSMYEFQRVRGIGPAMAGRLEGRVTFSQSPRHFRVEDRGKRAANGARARAPARPHAP
jgi:competence protein ComEA